MEQTRYLPGKAHIRYGIWAVSSLMLILLFVLSRQAFAASSVSSVSDRLITVYDQGDERTFVTRTATIGDALREAGVTLSDADVVEPRTNTKMAASNYQVNIYRARPIVIEDGASKLQVTTAEQTPKRIMAAAGATMYDEDKAHIELSQNPLADGGAGLRLVVDRATIFTFNLYGKTFTARTQATTVGAMLKEKNISLGAQDGKSASDKTPLVAGMNVSVWRNGKQTITQEEVVAKPIEEIKDADRERGFREVRTPGKDGKRNATYEIEMRDGREISRKEIASVVTLTPVKEIVVVGTKLKESPYGGTLGQWLSTLRACETGGDYTKNTGNGFYGGYQFMISTWNSIASKTGRGDLVGVRPDLASPADQDAMIIANTNMTAGLVTQNPGCYAKTGISNKPPAQ